MSTTAPTDRARRSTRSASPCPITGSCCLSTVASTTPPSRACAAAWRERGMSRTDQRRCDLLLQRVRGQLLDEGVLMAAATIEQGIRPGVADDAANSETLAAVCTFSLVSRAGLGTDVRLSIPVLFGAFSKRGPTNDVASITDLEPPEVVHAVVRPSRPPAPALPAQRTERRVWSGGSARRTSCPSARRATSPASSSSAPPTSGWPASSAQLFAEYAETLTFFHPQDPTEMNTPPEVP